MAVRIRLKKMGRRHRPYFRLCAMDSRSPRNGRVIEELGTYDPMVPETDARAKLDGERIAYWMSVGALPTRKVGVLIKKYGKDGTHLDQQQQALNQLAASRSDAIAAATRAAQDAASVAAAKAEAAEKERQAEAAAAEAAAAEASAAAETASEEATESAAAKEQPKADAADSSADATATEEPATDSPEKETASE